MKAKQFLKTVALSTGIALAGAALVAPAQAAESQFNVPQQNLETALKTFAEQADIQLLFSKDDVRSFNTSGIAGSMEVEQALQKLLADTGLQYEFTAENSVVVKAVKKKPETVRRSAAVNDIMIEEIVVTAQKREQNLQDAAVAISALGRDSIEKRGLVSMSDYLPSLPGVSFQDRGAGQNQVIIRGLVADPQVDSSTVGVYFGETPTTGFGSPSSSGGAGNADIKLVDIERIEVLRGPQGSLYGSGSMGGTVRVVPASPNLDSFEGKIAAQYSLTDEEGGSNTMVQGTINLPLIEDTLATRITAYRFDNSGYIENVAASQPALVAGGIASGGVARNRDDVGGDEYLGFRISTLWQATDDLKITLGYLQQEIEQDGVPEVNTGMADPFQQVRLNTGHQGSRYESLTNKIEIANLLVDYELGWGSLSSSSSWTDYAATVDADLSHFLGASYYSHNTGKIDAFVEELRLTSQLDGPFQFLAGLYYEDKDDDLLTPWPWSGDSAFDTGPFLESKFYRTNEQKALFGELSYDITDEITATLGIRYFDYEITQLRDFNFLGAVVVKDEFLSKEESGETLKANLTWKPADKVMVYAQWAEGFRLGDVAQTPAGCDTDNDGLLDDVGFPAPDGIDSDTTENFELGIKSSLLDSRITVNGAIYRIDWEGMPVSIALPSCNAGITLNAGKSKSEGAELEMQAYLSDSLLMNLSASYGESILTEDAPNLGSRGDNLPGSADFNLGFGLEYQFSLANYNSFIRLDYAYVSEYYHNLAETGKASGDYNQVHLKSGVSIGNLDVSLFVNNLTNDDGFTWVETVWSSFGFSRAYRLRPRTVGLNMSYHLF